MPINVAPADILNDSWPEGWMPDLEDSGVPDTGLIDVKNLIPDRVTGALRTRRGRTTYSGFTQAGYKATSLNNFNINMGSMNDAGKQYLIVAVTTRTKDQANNVKLYAIDLQQADVNVLSKNNSNFESSFPGAWSIGTNAFITAASATIAKFESSDGVRRVYESDQSAKVTTAAAGSGASLTVTGLNPSTQYTFSLYTKVSSVDGNSQDLTLGIRDATTGTESVTTWDPTIGEWMRKNVTLTTGVATTSVIIGIKGAGTTNVVYIDAAQLELGASATTWERGGNSDQRIDDSGRIWSSVGSYQFGVVVDNKLFGGGETDPIYSWMPFYVNGKEVPDAAQFDPDGTMPQRSTTVWADATAYVVGDRREDGQYIWACIKDHTSMTSKRPKNGWNSADYWQQLAPKATDWVTSTVYEEGDIVAVVPTDLDAFPRGVASRTINTYSAFRALRDHTSSATNKPPSWVWEPARAAQTNVGIYHASRLWLRDTDLGTGRLRYSNRVKADGLWDPTDWESVDVYSAGFMDIRTSDGDDIRALASLGQNLLICKRRSTHILIGTNPTTWRLQQLADVGCVFKQAICVRDALAYFFSDEGLMVCDGSVVQLAPGGDKIKQWLSDSVEYVDTRGRITLHSFGDFIWIAIPTPKAGAVDTVLIYDPIIGSFWKQDFGTWDFATAAVDKQVELFMTSVGDPGKVYRYNSPGNEHTDDGASIPWAATFGWQSFSAGREERSVRRIWANVKVPSTAPATVTVSLKSYINYIGTAVWTTTKQIVAGAQGYVEGKVLDTAHAVRIRLEGDKSPAAIVSTEVQTKFRRKRYHRA